jgi:hypothetical protein
MAADLDKPVLREAREMEIRAVFLPMGMAVGLVEQPELRP